MAKTSIINKYIYYTLLFILSFAFIFPLLFMVINSFMDSKEIMTSYDISGVDRVINGSIDYMKIKFIPDNVSLSQYYGALIRRPVFLVTFWNSFIITVPSIIGQIFIAATGGYAFAKLKFPFRDKIFFVFILVMLMPYQVTLVPNYIILKKLGILGSFWSIILPGVFSAFGVFLLRQFMINIPDEYSQSAKIDGAKELSIFLHVILPQCKSGFASLIILNFIDSWNMVEQPLIFLDQERMHPLSIFLSKINQNDIGIAFACGAMYMLPAILVFLYGEEYLFDGIQLSGLK